MARYDGYNRSRLTGIGTLVNRRYYDLLWRWVRPRCVSDARVVEIGPGRGEMAYRITAAGASYLAVDQNPSDAVACQYPLIEARVPPLPVNPGSQSVIVASNVLEHTDSPTEAWEFLRSCRDGLCWGGWLLLVVPVVDRSLASYLAGCYTHGYPTHPYRVRTIVRDSGFALLRETIIRGGVAGFAGKVLWLPLQIIMDTLSAVLPDGIAYGKVWVKGRMLSAPCQITLWERT